jgi:hypothetical protein
VTIQLSRATLEVLEDLVANVFDRASVRASYTGRGMWGAEHCLGVVVDGVGELVQFVLAVETTARRLRDLAEEDESHEYVLVIEELLTFLDALENGGTPTTQDRMADQVIYYWPRVQVLS